MAVTQQDILQKLQQEILPLQGYKISGKSRVAIGCRAIESAFPDKQFAVAAVHELISTSVETTTASAAFISAILSALAKNGGVAAWISASPLIFPTALRQFNIDPSNIIFIHARNERQALWATEEALRCNGLTAVVSELSDLNFTNSRRFQLAVEQSSVTGFIIHHTKKQLTTNACVARWKITPQSSISPGDLPGIGFPRWKVELLKVRNGKPGSWIIEWNDGKFKHIGEQLFVAHKLQRKAG